MKEQPSIANLLARDESISLNFDRISGDYTHTVTGSAGDKIDAFLSKYDNIARHQQSGVINDRVALERVLADWYYYMDPMKHDPKAAGYVAEIAGHVFGEDGATLALINARKEALEYTPERTYTGAAAKLLTGLLFLPITYSQRVSRDRVVAASIEQVARDRKILDEFDGLVRDYTKASSSFSGSMRAVLKRDPLGGDLLSVLSKDMESLDGDDLDSARKIFNRVSVKMNTVFDSLALAEKAYDSVRDGALVTAMNSRSIDAVTQARKTIFSIKELPEMEELFRVWDAMPAEKRDLFLNNGVDVDGLGWGVDKMGWNAADFEASSYLDASALRAQKVARLVKAASSPDGDADDMASMMKTAIAEMGAFKDSDSMIFTVGHAAEAGLGLEDDGVNPERIFESIEWGKSLDSIDQKSAAMALSMASEAVRSLDEMASSPDPLVVERYKKSNAAEAREHLNGFVRRLSAVNGLELDALRLSSIAVVDNIGGLQSGGYVEDGLVHGAASSLDENRMPAGSVIFRNASEEDGSGTSTYFASYAEDSDEGRRARQSIRVFNSTLESTLKSFHKGGDLGGEIDIDAITRARAYLESPAGEAAKSDLLQNFDMANEVAQAGLHGFEDSTGALRELTPEEEKAREQMQKKIAAAVRKVIRSLFGGPQSTIDDDMDM